MDRNVEKLAPAFRYMNRLHSGHMANFVYILCNLCGGRAILRRQFLVQTLSQTLDTPQEGPPPGPDQWKGSDVKLIIAAIKPFKLEEVREALTAIGVRGMMVTEIKGFGSQSGHTEIYRGAEYAVSFLPKLKIEVAVPSDQVSKVIDAITVSAKTGQIGDGKIFVYAIDQAVRIRTGETDADAL